MGSTDSGYEKSALELMARIQHERQTVCSHHVIVECTKAIQQSVAAPCTHPNSFVASEESQNEGRDEPIFAVKQSKNSEK